MGLKTNWNERSRSFRGLSLSLFSVGPCSSLQSSLNHFLSFCTSASSTPSSTGRNMATHNSQFTSPLRDNSDQDWNPLGLLPNPLGRGPIPGPVWVGYSPVYFRGCRSKYSSQSTIKMVMIGPKW